MSTLPSIRRAPRSSMPNKIIIIQYSGRATRRMKTSWKSWFQSALLFFICTFYGVGSDTPILEPLTSDIFAPCCAKQHKHFMQYSLLWLLSRVLPKGHALGSTSGRQIWPCLGHLRGKTFRETFAKTFVKTWGPKSVVRITTQNEANISIQYSFWLGYGYTDSGTE